MVRKGSTNSSRRQSFNLKMFHLVPALGDDDKDQDPNRHLSMVEHDERV